MGFSLGDIWKGVKFINKAVDTVVGTPDAQPAPSLVGQKPDLKFARIREGLGAGLMSGQLAKGTRIGIDVPSRFDSKNQWINLQARYLSYLNMAEEFEAPGKVRRAIKLKVS